MKGDIEALEL